MRTGSVFGVLAAALASVLMSYGQYHAKQVKDCSIKTEAGDVAIGLDPIENVDEQQSYFGTDLQKRAIVPVLVLIENRGASTSVLFDRSKVTYGAASALAALPKPGIGKAVALSFIPLAGGFAAAHSLKTSLQIQDDLLKQELRSTTIAPGASTRGFLYIPAGGKSPREKIALRIPVTTAGSEETVNLELSF